MSRPWAKKSVNLSWVRDQGSSNNQQFRHDTRPQRNSNRKHQKNSNFNSLKHAASRNLVPQFPQSNATQSPEGGNATAPGEVWIKIILIFGAELPRDWLTETLGSALGSQVKLYNVHTDEKNLIVFLKIRKKQMSDFRVSLGHLREPTGEKPLSCDVSLVNEPGLVPQRVDSPHVLPPDWTEILKTCISHRYQSTARTLDLSNLHGDHDLMSQGLFLALNKAPVANTVCQLLIGNKTSLASLNLANNRLVSTVNFKNLVHPDILVEHLDVSQNPLNGIDSLSHLKGLRGLVSLDISETPIITRNRHLESTLINHLRIKFPDLMKLNGKTPALTVLTSRASDSGPLRPIPESNKGKFPNDEAKVSTLKFIKEYYDTFDSPDRDEKLLKYYSRESVLAFSLAPFVSPLNSQNSKVVVTEEGKEVVYEQARFSECQYENSRNLMRCKDDERREKMLNKGAVAICHFLGRLSKTEHLLDTFSVDVSIHTASLVVLTVTGLLYEVNTSTTRTRKTLRCFARTLFITAAEGKILQDDITFLQPNEMHCKDFIASHKASSSSTTGHSSNNVKSANLNSTDKESILKDFMVQTGMNSNYAQQCLEEYGWDSVRAWTAFKATKDAGRIPQIAFT